MMTTSAVVCAQEEEEEESASIDLEMRTPDFDAETVRAELSAELGTPIGKPGASPRARLIVEHPTDRFRVALMQPDRSVVRNVDLPRNPKSARETLVLLLAAMTRDEAGPLLEELRKKKQPAAKTDEQKLEPPKVDPPSPKIAPPPMPAPVPPAQVRPLEAAEEDPCKQASTVPVAIDFAPFVGMSTAYRARDIRWFSVGALGTTAHGTRGFEVSGVVGIDRCTVSGAQIAGVVAIARTVHGAQISGVVNVAGEVEGSQVGMVNVATGRVKGPQIGVVNIADESDAPIGVVNVIKHGRHHVDVWGNETGMTMAGVQLGGTWTHAILGIGARPGPDGVRFVYGGGIGGHIPISEAFALDVDVMHHDLAAFLATPKLVQLSQARAILAWTIVPRLAVFGGPTLNVLVSNDRRDYNPSPYGAFPAADGDVSVRVWPGITLGVRAL
jgi:hypothetical protein